MKLHHRDSNSTLKHNKRACKDIEEQSIRELLHVTSVRPQLEFSSQLRSPLEVKCQPMLGVVQRRATKFILNNPENIEYKEYIDVLRMMSSNK